MQKLAEVKSWGAEAGPLLSTPNCKLRPGIAEAAPCGPSKARGTQTAREIMHSFTWIAIYEFCAYFFVGSLVFLLAVACDQEIEKTRAPFYKTLLDPLNSWIFG